MFSYSALAFSLNKQPTIMQPRRIHMSVREEFNPREFAVDVGVTALRISTCALMLHHGIDKVQNVDVFSTNVVSKFFGFLPGPPQFWTLSAATTQIVGSMLLSIGMFSRLVAFSMSATMATAVTFHLLNTGLEDFPLGVPAAHSYNFELATMYVFVLVFFTAYGAGAWSVDRQVLGDELLFYSKLFRKDTAR